MYQNCEGSEQFWNLFVLLHKVILWDFDKICQDKYNEVPGCIHSWRKKTKREILWIKYLKLWYRDIVFYVSAYSTETRRDTYRVQKQAYNTQWKQKDHVWLMLLDIIKQWMYLQLDDFSPVQYVLSLYVKWTSVVMIGNSSVVPDDMGIQSSG